ncbi:NAD(P)-dependent dehydrogenase (short-subunit alcohol dehydrogenase family) [Novosphingobium sp. PhB165]|uniref:SDR family oxidoreductase n=1 Tax=Novosphingobium sp. PhB165 TaxID=2485105 RepID=UPI00104DA553|nr:SDR family oxidoreductase [Novosphingobium sp. PhB165]TCM14598.1 NAD(P)-dependent dehydrogenase (short-subunit alcohol dehydrogenase family) [Novosphingobium sp. PhB165]
MTATDEVTRSGLPTAIVVGAGGLGMAVARRLAQTHHIVLADIDAALAARQAAALIEEGGEATAFPCDVTSETSVAALGQLVRGRGGFRSLVHVAGLSIAAGNFAAIVNVNLRGPALVARELLPLAGPGICAVLIASMAAHLSSADGTAAEILSDPTHADLASRLAAHLGPQGATPSAAYALSKIGLLKYARASASDWGRRGARIVSLSPGMIATPMGKGAYAESPNKARMFARSPLGREGAMHEIADAVEFLVSDRASFISGTDLLVDGGLSAALTYT